MGRFIVRVTSEMFMEIMTEGRTFPDRNGKRLKVVKGIPEQSRLVSVSHDAYFVFGQVALMFESPMAPPNISGSVLPEVEVRYEYVDADATDEYEPLTVEGS